MTKMFSGRASIDACFGADAPAQSAPSPHPARDKASDSAQKAVDLGDRLGHRLLQGH